MSSTFNEQHWQPSGFPNHSWKVDRIRPLTNTAAFRSRTSTSSTDLPFDASAADNNRPVRFQGTFAEQQGGLPDGGAAGFQGQATANHEDWFADPFFSQEDPFAESSHDEAPRPRYVGLGERRGPLSVTAESDNLDQRRPSFPRLFVYCRHLEEQNRNLTRKLRDREDDFKRMGAGLAAKQDEELCRLQDAQRQTEEQLRRQESLLASEKEQTRKLEGGRRQLLDGLLDAFGPLLAVIRAAVVTGKEGDKIRAALRALEALVAPVAETEDGFQPVLRRLHEVRDFHERHPANDTPPVSRATQTDQQPTLHASAASHCLWSDRSEEDPRIDSSAATPLPHSLHGIISQPESAKTAEDKRRPSTPPFLTFSRLSAFAKRQDGYELHHHVMPPTVPSVSTLRKRAGNLVKMSSQEPSSSSATAAFDRQLPALQPEPVIGHPLLPHATALLPPAPYAYNVMPPADYASLLRLSPRTTSHSRRPEVSPGARSNKLSESRRALRCVACCSRHRPVRGVPYATPPRTPPRARPLTKRQIGGSGPSWPFADEQQQMDARKVDWRRDASASVGVGTYVASSLPPTPGYVLIPTTPPMNKRRR
ncbi:unnamed protein product [Vitrella brassicaformis CCMP3155]|uniref:Uncharacterized protein n=2 Tax=Vitrella brassicaformis TaxID=1169539 RepID=A0A0G4EZA6_VITBC|nr:unnamed protein product [Vitrella brassicaformis CCMP3155]|eukprot:CEM04112.1 unnamed protein product [Vitrella brassicaformis CCMP3155]